jgi:hypothetical protein
MFMAITLFANACSLSREGIVSKRLGSLSLWSLTALGESQELVNTEDQKLERQNHSHREGDSH